MLLPALTCENLGDRFIDACTSRANGCPAGCEAAYSKFYDKCFYEPYKLFQKKRVHIWKEKDGGNKLMTGFGTKAVTQGSSVTFDVMDYVAAASLKMNLRSCNFKDTTGIISHKPLCTCAVLWGHSVVPVLKYTRERARYIYQEKESEALGKHRFCSCFRTVTNR